MITEVLFNPVRDIYFFDVYIENVDLDIYRISN